ncbi:hypothetical protein QOZ80_6BG0467150 [Eleusine coracana subsp. coracana]|nr:hypothetical protein QOZ80_6BG0467150 [Eleusine coracana subsp. coracana]
MDTTEISTNGSRDDEPSSWLEVEDAVPFTGTKTTKAATSAKRWSTVVTATLLVLIMTMPPLIILGSRLGASVVWIKSTVAVVESKKDVLLGGLLVPGFDEASCASRYQSAFYYKNLTRQPSPYLIKRLREQEALQRRCGPGTGPYSRASERLRTGATTDVDHIDGCSYLVLISYRGLGNRMLAATSAFLYALLTNRVLLMDLGYGDTLPRLFCEPFPGTTWLLPHDFPVSNFKDLNESAPEAYGNVAVNRSGSVSGLRFVYLHLDHAASAANLLAYCDDHREFLHRAQWTIMRADQYIAAGIFFNPAYRDELDRLFPRKDAVFYLLSRYLLHPTNEIWGMVLACTSQEHLLPEVVSKKEGGGVPPPIPTAGSGRSKAVLITGLSSWYHDNIREMYWKSAAAGGEVVSVHQASHEGSQRWFHGDHDVKALAEIYLLSLTDRIVTSGWSTFGYAGTGLGGLTPYIMFRGLDGLVPSPPCTKAMSMEPCSFAVPHFDCTKKEIDRDVLQVDVPHVRACDDVFWGVKLTDTV